MTLDQIAADVLGFKTLKKEYSGSDFKEVSVWQVSSALDRAYDLGVQETMGEYRGEFFQVFFDYSYDDEGTMIEVTDLVSSFPLEDLANAFVKACNDWAKANSEKWLEMDALGERIYPKHHPGFYYAGEPVNYRVVKGQMQIDLPDFEPDIETPEF